ncbi:MULTISPECIES: protein-disulfide reductase DsbD [Asticcacaulis]|uniref:protein-disulfide reductase DsbD family protein n=1 Tax=Asticcacaulis TaxID=76890 RepID=UPI001AE59F5A|nr:MULTISPECIES: thioredoxin family protein [Asticcacaulis]MBP2158839.1 thiol:disulfide interchange protein DsbD [Asticcacaulis solisilvae]MDR6799885.1 thiol:disulfide interchange protein DsbD [Asticcacaulis sp. BE141]
MLAAIAAALIGGVILNLMPCVFPVISLKALSLLRHGDSPAAARKDGAAFAAGVVATMLLLAGVLIAARAGGAAIGWGFQLQSPVVIAVLALVMLGSALNLAGLFEVGASVQGVAGGIQVKSGPMGSALTGALAIVVATPCTAPFMAGAVGYALVQPPLVALAVFLALAIGFAAPFTLIAFVPALARMMPKPGAWMETLKKALAFPMFGAAAWLAWVLAQQAGTDALAGLFISAVVLSLACWLYGMAQRRRLMGQKSVALFAVTAALGALLIVPVVHLAGAAPVAAKAPKGSETIAWSPQAIAEHQGKGRPILVNFTASWCITCQVNERTTLSTPAVKAALERTGSLYMIADSTNYNPDIENALAALGRGGMPVYVVYPADGGAPKLLPEVLSPDIVITALNEAS